MLRAPSVTPPPRRKGYPTLLDPAEVNLRIHPFIAAALIFHSSAAAAHDATDKPGTTATLSRHHTTNALDTPDARADWFTALRGSIDQAAVHELGETRITAQFDGRRYDTFRIEDDLAVALAATTTMRPSDQVELRGSLSWRVADKGEELEIGPLLLGTRERRHTLGTELTAGVRLDAATVAVFGLAASRESVGPTRFSEELILPAVLDADRTRLGATVSLTQTRGSLSYGAAGAAAVLRDDPFADLPALTLGHHSARLQAGIAEPGRYSVGAAVGFGLIHLRDTDFCEIRPIYELAGEVEFGAGFSLRGTVRAGFETVETDDPLVSFARRAELEAAYAFGPRMRVGAGLFRELRENRFLDHDDDLRGVYAEAGWRAHERLSLLVRIDATRHRLTPIDVDRDTVETKVALTAHL